MTSRGTAAGTLGPRVHRQPFAVQSAKRFVLAVFGGLTLMVSVWTTLVLGNAVFAMEHESRLLFRVILGFFVLLIVVGFNVAWWVLKRYPHALAVHERGVVLEHGAQTRFVPFEQVRGIDQRDQDNMQTYVVLVADGSEIPFGAGPESRETARVLVERAGLAWSEEPLRAVRPALSQPA